MSFGLFKNNVTYRLFVYKLHVFMYVRRKELNLRMYVEKVNQKKDMACRCCYVAVFLFFHIATSTSPDEDFQLNQKL